MQRKVGRAVTLAHKILMTIPQSGHLWELWQFSDGLTLLTRTPSVGGSASANYPMAA